MSRSQARAAAYFVAFDGQSLVYAPDQPLGGVNDFPHQLMPVQYPHVPWKQTAASGVGWTGLGPTAFRRTWPYGKAAPVSILVACGGTSDLLGDLDDGATVYADMWGYTDLCRTAGFDVVVGCTITPSSGITGTAETARTDANTLIMANSLGKFDYTVDLSTAVPNPAGANYGDGLHFTTAGAALAAAAVQVALDAAIPAAYR